MISTEQIFSLFVFGETLPKPTDVSDEKVKYKAVTYLKLHSVVFYPQYVVQMFMIHEVVFMWKKFLNPKVQN